MELVNWIKPIVLQTIVITTIVFVLLVIVEILYIRFTPTIENKLVKRRGTQYILGAILGSIPGCTGTFAMDALYMAGLVGFGGIVSAMVTTFGDEAFVIIGQMAMPNSAITIKNLAVLFISLFVLGILAGFLADKFIDVTGMKFCPRCKIEKHEDIDTSSISKIPTKHFFKEHIVNHILKKHIPNIALWLFASLIVVSALEKSFNMETIITNNKFFLILAAATIGILPISGPNIVFISMFAQGILPFSVLLTNSIVQDGHGLLPILGFSLDDAAKIKVFNLVFGLAVGFTVAAFGG